MSDDLHAQIRNELGYVTEEVYLELYFDVCDIVENNDGGYTIICPHQFLLDHIKSSYAKLWQQRLDRILTFVIGEVQTYPVSNTKKGKQHSPTTALDRFFQLKLFEDKSVMGNVFLRSALFPAIRKGEMITKPQTVPVSKGEGSITITFGKVYSQFTMDVLLSLVKIWHESGQKEKGNNYIVVTAYEVMAPIASMGTKAYERFYDECTYLNTTQLSVKTKKGTMNEKILTRFAIQDDPNPKTKKYAIEFNPALVDLIIGIDEKLPAYTYIDMPTRKALGKSALAKWLHGFISSHKSTDTHSWISLNKLRTLSGYTTTTSKPRFREAVLDSMKKLQTQRIVSEYTLGKNDVLYWRKYKRS